MQPVTPSTRACAVCGGPLPEGTPRRICPNCAFEGALLLQSQDSEVARGAELGLDAEPRQPGKFASDLATRSFGDYELIELIAQGGMGVVYRARQKSLNRIVALKTVLFGPQASPDFVKRFQAEAVVAASLQHPNIVAIHDVGIHDGQHFFVMDYVDGPSLARVAGRQPLPPRRAAAYLKTIAEAIHYAHEHGILHRDLKPSNVLIDAQGQPRVTDFGLAKSLSDAQVSTSSSQLTLSWEVLGSPSYIPPEQALGKRGNVSRQSDVYALGATLYHLVTGRPPFQGETVTEVLQQVLNTEPLAPRLLQPSLPRDLETICLKCLEKEIPRRYRSAQELAEDLGRFLEGEPIRARPVGALGRAWKWCRRRPALAAMGAALVLTGVLGLGGVLWQWNRAASGELLAQRNAYAGDMLLLQRALGEHQRAATMRLLNDHRPVRLSSSGAGAPGADLCDWEWRYLWRLCRSDESVSLHRYASGIHTLALSGDGQVLAVGFGNRTALWSLPQRTLIAELPVPAARGALALSPRENLLAIGTWSPGQAHRVELWSLDTQSAARTLNRNANIRSLAFSPDGRWLATFDDGGAIAVEEWKSGRVLTNFSVALPRMPGAGVVAFSPNGTWLAIGEDYGPIRLLNMRTGASVRHDTETTAGVTALAFSPDSKLLAAGFGYSSGLVRVWHADPWELRGGFTNQQDNCSGLAFTSDGSRLASAYTEGTVRLWQLATETEERCLQNLEEDLTSFAMLPDNHTVVTGGSGGSLRLWDMVGAAHRPVAYTNWTVSLGFSSLATADGPTFARETLGAAARRFGFAFTPDSRGYIATDTNGSLALWDVRSIRVTERLTALGSNHWGLALSPDGSWLATGNTSGKLTVWDWSTRREATNFAMNAEWFGLLRFSRSGNFFFATVVDNAWDGRTRIWRTGQWQEVTPATMRSANIWSAELAPNDRTLAVGYGDGSIRLFDFATGEQQATLNNHAAQVNGLLFTPDGRKLISSSLDRSTRIWDVSAGRESAMLHGLVGFAIALTPDGRRLATGGELPESAVKLWDPIAGREVLSLPGRGEFFGQVAFSPDGSLLAAISLSGIANLWRAPSWQEIEAADKADAVPAASH